MNRPLFARIQDRASAVEERRGGTARRRQLLAGLSGRVVEIGAGSGVSFAHYPAAVTELVAIEPEPNLRELARVVRPGGELRFYEHVAARNSRLATLQRALDAAFWPRLFGNCHTHRDTAATIARSAFTVDACERFSFRPTALGIPVAPRILGRAHR
jgi:hypothetical protein